MVADAAEQELLFRALIAAHTKRFGDQSAQVALAWNNLGTALVERGDLDGAMRAYVEARERAERFGGPDHPMTLNTRRSMAVLLDLTGRREESLREMRDILAGARRRGIQPETQASLRAQTAGVLLRLGRLSEARSEMQSSLAELRRIEPEGAPNRTNAQLGLGLVLLADGRADEAEAELAAVLAIRRQRFPAGHAKVAEAQVALGRARIARGDIEEGRALIRAGFEKFSRSAVAHPQDVEAARRALETPPAPASAH